MKHSHNNKNQRASLMATADLGKYAENFESWRKMIATVPTIEAKLTVFTNLANDAAGYIARGLDKTVAVDELHDIATASGIVGVQGIDAVQTTIADALMQTRTDEPLWAEQPKPNGRSGKEVALPLPPILSKAGFMEGFIAPNYLVDGILQRRFIYALTGQTGHAKTAVALLLAQLVASKDGNAMLGKHRVEKGRVIYFVGENPDDVRMRIIGIDSRRDDDTDDNIWFIPGIFKIEEMMVVLLTDIMLHGAPALIIVDTSAAYFLGDEELNNVQMGNYARVLRRLTTLPGGPCVLVLCHPIKHASEPAQLLPRGGGAYLAEMDGNLTLWRQDDLATLDHSGKFRGASFEPITFKLEPIKDAPKLKDAKGRQISTVHAVVISQKQEDTEIDQETVSENLVLTAMLKNPDGSLASWAADLGWYGGHENMEPMKKKVHRILERLDRSKREKLVFIERRKWALTEKGKELARKAALAFEAADRARRPEPEQLKLTV